MAEKLEIIITAKDKFSKTMKSLRGMLPSVKTLAIGAGAGASALGAGLFAIANSTAKAGDEFQKMSLRLGLSTEMLSGMKHAVELSGSSMEAFEKGVRTLAKRMSDADEGLVEAERSFEALGIQVKNADGSLKNLDNIMPQIAEGLATMDDNTKRVALAQELLGRSGTALLPLFKQGAEGLRKMTEEARALGITFDKTGADEAAAFRDNMLRLQRVFTGIKTQIGQAIIPAMSNFGAALQEVGKELVSVISKNKDEIATFATSFLNTLTYLAQGVGSGVAIIIDSWNSLQIVWETLRIAFSKFSIDILEGLQTIKLAYINFLEKAGLWERMEDIFSIKPDPKTLEMFKRLGIQCEVSAKSFKEMLLGSQETVTGLKALQEQAERSLIELKKHPSALQSVTDAFALFRGLIEKIKAEGVGIPPFDTENVEKTKENIDKITNYSMEGIYATRVAMINMQEDIDAAVEESTQNFEKQMELHKTLADETARALQRNFSNLFFDVFTGDLKTIDGYFKAFTQSMLRAFSDMIAQMLIKWAVMKAAMSFGFGGGFLGGLFHEGGVVGQSKVPMRFIPMPRLHSGLRANEFPAILERGETVFSKEQTKELSRYEQAVIIENLNVHVLENAHTGDTLMRLPKKDIQEFTEDKLIPALRSLKLAGITP